MAIYRFYVRDTLGLVEDNDGTELPDLYSALIEALRSAHEFLAEASATPGMQFEIADATGLVVLKVPIGTAALMTRKEAA